MIKLQLKNVKGFEDVRDYYYVCRDGDRCWVEGEYWKVINGGITKTGYRQIGLMLNSGKQKMFLQHRIFMLAFTPNPENKSQVNHKDGVKTNNLLSNLDWATPKENIVDSFATGLAKPKFGDQNGRAKLRDSEIPLIFEMRKNGTTQQSIADHFGVSNQQISHILNGKQRSQNLGV